MSVKTLVLTLIGPDQSGIVESVAACVRDSGGNWVESRMSHLAGQFAGILHVEVPEDRAATLAGALCGLGDRGLTVTVAAEDISAAVTGAVTGAGSEVVTLDLIGQDRPGIVAQLSQVLVANGINVEELETGCSDAPMSGERLFRARGKFALPETLTREAFREQLEAIASDLMVDITLEGEGVA